MFAIISMLLAFIQNVANFLAGRYSAQCRMGRANYNKNKTIRKATLLLGVSGYTVIISDLHAFDF